MKPVPLLSWFGLAVVGVWALGCSAPGLPCDKEDWKAICNGTPGTGGMSGTGGMPATGGAPGTDGPPAAELCAQYPTLGDMDKFFQGRCANTDACHGKGNVFGDYKSPGVWQRVTNTKTVVACPGTPFADPGGDLSKSMIWVKTQETPTCPNGASAGIRMPNPPAKPLDAAETKCLENFLKALKPGT